MDAEILAILPMWYVVFLLSVTCHEAAHALVAKWGGDLTAYHAGQVTLNPLPHILREPLGMVLMPILSLMMSGALFGWGSAPYDPYWEQRYPRRAAWMALAGPVANIILAILAALVIKIGIASGVFVPIGGPFMALIGSNSGQIWEAFAQFMGILFCQNVMLALFNLLPVPPLDGNTVITLLMPEEMGVRFREMSRTGFLSMFGIWIAMFVGGRLLWPVLAIAIKLLIYRG